MAGSSTISISLKLEGDIKSFKQLTSNAEGLNVVMNGTIKEAERLKKSLVNWSQGVQAINAITQTVNTVSSAFSAFSDKMKGIQQENILTAQLTGKTGEEMTKLRNAVKATSDHFGEDFGETMQAVNALARGFGITAEEALQLVKDGFVSGANANGEFIDTLKEYPRYFKEAGLSAEQFVAITTNAAKQGIYSDKGVDVIKEGNLRIREMTKATADALNNIGISAEKVQEDLANGSLTTFDVMQMVAAKLNELPASSAAVGTAIADIFGGPGEDAGLEYIKTLATVQTNMDAVKASAGEMATAQEKQIQMQEDIKNGLSGLIDLTAIYTNVQPYVDMAAQVGMATTGLAGLVKTFKAMNIVSAVSAVRIAAVSAVQKILNFVMSMSPLGITVKIVGLLAAGLVTLYNNSEDFRNICVKVWEVIKPLGEALIKILLRPLKSLVESLKIAWNWLAKILGLSGKKVEVEVEVETVTTGDPDAPIDYSKYDSAPGAKKETAKKSKGVKADPVLRENAVILSEITENIEYYQKLLGSATAESAVAINREIAMWEKKADAIRNAGKEAKKAKKVSTETTKSYKFEAATLADIRTNIDILNEELQTASIEEAASINRTISAWNEKADAIRNAGIETKKTNAESKKLFKEGWGSVKGVAGSIDGITSSLEGNKNAWQTLSGIVDGFIGLYESVRSIIGIIDQITGATHALTAAKTAEESATIAATTAEVSGATATIASSGATTVAKQAETNANVANAVSGAMSAHSGIPFVGIALGLAAVAAILATMAAIPKFANGGIVSGPTLAMVGEYGGASNNPEVIAPLDKLRTLLAPRGDGEVGRVEFEIKGRTLVGILNKEANLHKRS